MQSYVTGVVGSRGGWDFGFNFGGGVGFRMGDDAGFTIESRYHYVKDRRLLRRSSISARTDGHYYPLPSIRF
jgi:hypothetical protein